MLDFKIFWLVCTSNVNCSSLIPCICIEAYLIFSWKEKRTFDFAFLTSSCYYSIKKVPDLDSVRARIISIWNVRGTHSNTNSFWLFFILVVIGFFFLNINWQPSRWLSHYEISMNFDSNASAMRLGPEGWNVLWIIS